MNKVLKGDALEVLQTLPTEYINCAVTSPPYWGLRDYGVEGQLGLEKTFEEYIDKLCTIFDETKRVLRKDGTLWVNLGDTYSNNGEKSSHHGQGKSTLRGGHVNQNEQWNKNTSNLKVNLKSSLPSKSLTLIPFRFAIEMTKRRGFVIKNELDRAWLAGIIEGEGCIHIHKRTNGRKNPTYGLFLSIHNTNKKMIDRVVQLTGLGGNIQTTRKDRNFTLYRWNAMSDNAKMVLREVYPYLITKRNQARCALHCPSSGKNAEECWDNIKRMHNYKKPTREYPEPEVGGIDPWILRNVIIWKKPNCMPSSAKDRFTVDFEYLFFFVKNKKYWFEQQFEPHLSPVTNKIVGRKGTDVQQSQGDPNGYHAYGEQGRNKRTVWTIPTKPYPEAHFAVYPAELIRTCIKAGCPKYGVVLDPFAGSGTTLEEAIRQGKDYIGIELKDDYIDLIEKRLSKVQVSLI